MIVLAGFLIGALWGAFTAKRRQGTKADMAQYAVGFGIAFALVGLFLTLLLEKMV